MKKITLCALCFLICLQLCSYALAVEKLEDFQYVKDEGVYIGNFILVENGISRTITYDEFLKLNIPKEIKLKNNLQRSAIEPRRAGVIYFSKFVETNRSENIDRTKKVAVTPWFEARYNDEKITVGESKTITSSFSVSLTSNKKTQILAAAGASYSHSVSTSTTFSGTQTIPKGKQGRVMFAPTILTLKGNVEDYHQSDSALYPTLDKTTFVTSELPKKVGSYADGLYYTELKALN